jgi:hypothetical protein
MREGLGRAGGVLEGRVDMDAGARPGFMAMAQSQDSEVSTTPLVLCRLLSQILSPFVLRPQTHLQLHRPFSLSSYLIPPGASVPSRSPSETL